MRRCTITLAILAPLAVALFIYPQWSSTALESSVFQQKRSRPSRRVAGATASRKPVRDYSQFSHTSRSHRQQECSSCHQAPTPNWRAVSDFPDVTDYPDHASCVKCHRQQFYRGARPAICTICHTSVSPRDDARFPFRKPTGLRQFTIEFPHDRHQDVIASHRPWSGTSVETRLTPAPFLASSHARDKQEKKYNNCAICHATNEMKLKPPPGGWIDSFVPRPAAFKTVPANHASCFNCHWKSQEPTRNDCGECHKISGSPIFTAWPGKRISPRFTHDFPVDHVLECTTCHINITAATTLKGLQPDVPITSCAGCHWSPPAGSDAVTIETEMIRRNNDPNFVCAKCHTSETGRKAVPVSHSALLSR